MFRSESLKIHRDQKYSDYEKDDFVSLTEEILSENTNSNDPFED